MCLNSLATSFLHSRSVLLSVFFLEYSVVRRDLFVNLILKVLLMYISKKTRNLALATGAVSVLAVAPAHATLNTAVGTSFTTLQTDGLALVDLAWPVVTALTVAFIIIGLFKKAAAKAV
jgi:hypothetical protein